MVRQVARVGNGFPFVFVHGGVMIGHYGIGLFERLSSREFGTAQQGNR